MKQRLTVSLDSDLLQAARKVAAERGIPVNQLVRDYLTTLVEEANRQESVEKLQEIFRTSKLRLGKITWKREDLYDRSL